MKPKVLHIVNDLVLGGVTFVLYQLIMGHKQSSYEYAILNLSGKGDKETIKKFEGLGIKIYNTNYIFDEGYSMFDQYKKAYFTKSHLEKNKEVFEAIRGIQPDIIHTHVLPFELYVLKKGTKQFKGLFIHTDHLVRFNSKAMSSFSRLLVKYPFKRFYKGVNVIAVNEAVAVYLRNFKIDKKLKRLYVVTNKLAGTDYRISYSVKEEYKVVYVARISAVKGHEDLINAWGSLPPLSLHLYIVGPDGLGGKIHKQAATINEENPITFTGPLDGIPEFLKNADMAVFPSHKEGLPIALLEKMQLGIPCIVSDIEELKGLITDKKNGLLFRCGNEKDMAEKIIQLASDIKLRESIGKEAAKTISERFVSKLDGIHAEYEEIYSDLLRENGNILPGY